MSDLAISPPPRFRRRTDLIGYRLEGPLVVVNGEPRWLRRPPTPIPPIPGFLPLAHITTKRRWRSVRKWRASISVDDKLRPGTDHLEGSMRRKLAWLILGTFALVIWATLCSLHLMAGDGWGWALGQFFITPLVIGAVAWAGAELGAR